MLGEATKDRCLRMEAAVEALRSVGRRRRPPPKAAQALLGEPPEDDDPFELAELRALSCACPRCVACREA